MVGRRSGNGYGVGRLEVLSIKYTIYITKTSVTWPQLPLKEEPYFCNIFPASASPVALTVLSIA